MKGLKQESGTDHSAMPGPALAHLVAAIAKSERCVLLAMPSFLAKPSQTRFGGSEPSQYAEGIASQS